MPPSPETPKQHKEPVGPIVGIVIILIVMIAGAVYFWYEGSKPRVDSTPVIPGDDSTPSTS